MVRRSRSVLHVINELRRIVSKIIIWWNLRFHVGDDEVYNMIITMEFSSSERLEISRKNPHNRFRSRDRNHQTWADISGQSNYLSPIPLLLMTLQWTDEEDLGLGRLCPFFLSASGAAYSWTYHSSVKKWLWQTNLTTSKQHTSDNTMLFSIRIPNWREKYRSS